MAQRLLRGVKWSVGGTIVGGGAGGLTLYLHQHNWDLRSTGVVRFGRAVVAAAQVVVDYKWTLSGVQTGTPDYVALKSKVSNISSMETTPNMVHRRSAERLRSMCCTNRGCFIKVGQHLGALDYLLPLEYVETFRVLHSNAPQSDLAELETVFKEETGKQFQDVFSSFTPTPCGTASLAQVHRATLKKDGSEVAVKIQHPKVREHSHVDLRTMEFLVHMVARIFPDFKFVWLAEESKRNLPRELDFYNEARNCERVGDMFKHFKFLKVPAIHWDLTTERVLTMEYCPGAQVNDREYFVKHNVDVNEVTRMLGRLYSEMIFVKGYVHSDPHPGNVLVHKTEQNQTQIVLLDHGLYANLTDTFRVNYCRLWQTILAADLDGIKKYSEAMGTGHLYPLFACIVTARSWKSVSGGIDKKTVTTEEDEEIKANAAMYLPEISDILNSIPREMLLILKTNDLLRGIEMNLRTRADAASFLTMSRCCVRALSRHDREHCNSWWRRFKILLVEHLTLFKLSLYEMYLRVQETSLIRAVRNLPLTNVTTKVMAS